MYPVNIYMSLVNSGYFNVYKDSNVIYLHIYKKLTMEKTQQLKHNNALMK